MRKNYIIATAGHIDHGKTSLIRSLTGKDCDTHPEEKLRGITIHLGFSHIQLSDDVYAGIVDVPGHKDFIDTMISGINGIDLVLFIVAADEGFMPQTHEHLQILDILGINKGLIILTKCDLVDAETLELAKEDIREKTQNTFLENAIIIPTSAKTGENIDKIKSEIMKIIDDEALNPPSASPLGGELGNTMGYFRLYPDRFFQVKGFGSVVTGTVLSGKLEKNDTIYLIPRNEEVKIRKMESYGQEVQGISAGQRASLNLTNFDKDDFTKGIMFCDRPYHTTSLIDVELSLFNIPKHFELWSTVEFHTATIQSRARIHLIDKDKLFSGETCIAQVHLEKAVALCFGDRFIVRNTSGDLTLGGGKVIDAFPLHHRRRTAKVKELLKLRVSNSLLDLVCSEIEKSIKPVSLSQVSERLFTAINAELLTDCPEKYTQYNDWFWTKVEQERLENRVIKYLQVAHKNNPLDNRGKPPEEFISLINTFPESSRSVIIKRVLEILEHNKIIEKRQETFALTSHKVILNTKEHGQIYAIDQFILNQKMKTPLWSDLIRFAAERDVNEKRLKQIIFNLVSRKRVFHHEGEYIHTFNVKPAREKLLNYLKEHPDGITIAEFRDLIDGNRKICLILINMFDNEGIIQRVEDRRVITEKGKLVIDKG